MSESASDANPVSANMPGLYARLCAPDRDISLDQKKSPLVAAVLSVIVPGLGQLYNRQLIRAAWWAIFFFATLLLWALCGLAQWWPFASATPGWRGSVGAAIDRIDLAFVIIVVGLWLVGVIDALRIAIALRQGSLVVRFSFKKQAALLAAGMVPLAGALTPDETCSPAELSSSFTSDLTQKLLQRLIARKLRRVFLLAVLLLGIAPVVLGAIYAIPWLIATAAAFILVAAVTILTT